MAKSQQYMFDALDNAKENASDMAMMEDAPLLQGVCKDCGNGTLNNELNPAFQYFEMDDQGYFQCLRCASTHVDIL